MSARPTSASALSAPVTRDIGKPRFSTNHDWHSPPANSNSVLRPWFGWMVAVWCVGVLVCSSRPLIRMAHAPAACDGSRFFGNGRSVLAAALSRMSRRLELRRAVQVMHSTLAQVPVVVGYLRPVILLPVNLATSIPPALNWKLDPGTRILAHVRRHDFCRESSANDGWGNVLFFYHPGIWLLSRRIRIEREHCCDDLAVNLLGNRVEYGRALLAIEELRGQSSVLALGAGGSSLLSRVRRIATGTSDRKVASLADRWPAALLGVTLIGVTCFITMHRTVAADDAARVRAS